MVKLVCSRLRSRPTHLSRPAGLWSTTHK